MMMMMIVKLVMVADEIDDYDYSDDDDDDDDELCQVLVRQELYRKHGYAIQADEEQLRTKLEAIYSELSAPMQFKVSRLYF